MSDQQEFPDNTAEYTDVEHTETESTEHAAGTELALPGQNLPDKVYIIPIHNRPFFPAQVLPVIVYGTLAAVLYGSVCWLLG